MNDGSSKRWSTSRPQPTSVSVFDKPHWRTILTTKDKAEADGRSAIKAQIEEITPKPKKR